MQKSYLQFQSLVLAARKRPNDCQARDQNPNITPEVLNSKLKYLQLSTPKILVCILIFKVPILIPGLDPMDSWSNLPTPNIHQFWQNLHPNETFT